MSLELVSDLGLVSTDHERHGVHIPNIMQHHISKEMVAAYNVKKSRRAKSTEPRAACDEEPYYQKSVNCTEETEPEKSDYSLKLQDNMSKTELINCYRLLMGEKLRLERFLSIVTKNNEMARNRLESDLLDAMMCIEDLKQALELRMARRSKIDPRDAEERRYLIRQNKKLLNQLYESAKKIEKLELTKVEMKEQLELLDFQILEVENQKALMEEELRKLPPRAYATVQTEDVAGGAGDSKLVIELRQQLSAIKSELCHQKAETAAALAKHQHLDNLVRELRRDNVELRDQLAKLDDAENSLAESDKPLVRDTRLLQTQLDTQLEAIRELETKLQASRDYATELETRLQTVSSHDMPDSNSLHAADVGTDQDAMYQAHGNANRSGLRVARVDDLLLQETIRTFHALLAERDQELAQLRSHIRRSQAAAGQPDGGQSDASELWLPDLFEAAAQTELCMEQCENLSGLISTVADGGLVLTPDQCAKLRSELEQTTRTAGRIGSGDPALGPVPAAAMDVTFPQLVYTLKQVREQLERVDPEIANSMSPIPIQIDSNSDSATEAMQSDLGSILCNGTGNNMEDIHKNSLRPSTSGLPNSQGTTSFDGIHMPTDRPSSAPSAAVSHDVRNPRAPLYFNNQLQHLKELTDMESVHSRLTVMERRCQDLERRLAESNEELARVRADGRATEASLSAARRTEAALRRRLLIAMDVQGSNRHSIGTTLNAGAETPKNPTELEAALIKCEAINTSLTEAAQLDRARLHEQALNIAHLEAERRALHDRISTLQASEAGAQRGVVRLQALYEDMLREYSESRNQDLTMRSRERSQSSYRNRMVDPDGSNQCPQRTRSQITLNRLQERVTSLETENIALKQSVQQSEQNQRHPIGPCTVPGCVKVRHLLQAFQGRFSELLTQLCATRACLNKHGFTTSPIADQIDLAHPDENHKCLHLVQSVRNQLIASINQLPSANSLDGLRSTLTSCSGTLQNLQDWLHAYLDRTDTELVELRQILLGVQAYDNNGDKTLETQCIDHDSQQAFSCSIRVSKKPNLDLLTQKEREIGQLRRQVRNLEAEIQTTALKNDIE